MSGRRHAPPARISYAKPAKRKPSPWGEGVTPFGVTDVGSIVFLNSPIKRTGSPPHPSRLAPCHPLQAGEGLTQKYQLLSKPCLPLRGRWLGASRDGGSAPGSIGHSPSHALQRDSPLSEGAKRLCYIVVPTAPHPSLLRKATFPQGKALLYPGGLFRRFLPLNIRYLAGEACLAPTVHRREFPPITPSAGYIFFSAGRRRRRCRRPGSGGP